MNQAKLHQIYAAVSYYLHRENINEIPITLKSVLDEMCAMKVYGQFRVDQEGTYWYDYGCGV